MMVHTKQVESKTEEALVGVRVRDSVAILPRLLDVYSDMILLQNRTRIVVASLTTPVWTPILDSIHPSVTKAFPQVCTMFWPVTYVF